MQTRLNAGDAACCKLNAAQPHPGMRLPKVYMTRWLLTGFVLGAAGCRQRDVPPGVNTYEVQVPTWEYPGMLPAVVGNVRGWQQDHTPLGDSLVLQLGMEHPWFINQIDSALVYDLVTNGLIAKVCTTDCQSKVSTGRVAVEFPTQTLADTAKVRVWYSRPDRPSEMWIWTMTLGKQGALWAVIHTDSAERLLLQAHPPNTGLKPHSGAAAR